MGFPWQDKQSADIVGDGYTPRSLVGWLLRNWRRAAARPARLTMIERISLSPKHALVLVEAEGVHLLVATSTEGGSTFHPLNLPMPLSALPMAKIRNGGSRTKLAHGASAMDRISW